MSAMAMGSRNGANHGRVIAYRITGQLEIPHGGHKGSLVKSRVVERHVFPLYPNHNNSVSCPVCPIRQLGRVHQGNDRQPLFQPGAYLVHLGRAVDDGEGWLL